MIFFASPATASTPLSVTTDPTFFSEGLAGSSGNVGTSVLTITGGVAPYTALWLLDTGVDIGVTSPTSTTSSVITYSGLASVLDEAADNVTVTITDAIGQTAAYAFSVFVVRIL